MMVQLLQINYIIQFILLPQQRQAMIFNRKQIMQISPKNVTVNILDANSFFSLDYQQKQKHQQMCTTLNSFLGNHATNNNDKKSNFRKNGTPNHNTISIPVKSAQYHRKFLQTNLTNRMSIHPYIRIKRVDQLIQENKQRNNSLQNRLKAKQQQPSYLPSVTQCKTQRIDRSLQKQKILKSLTFDPENLHTCQESHNSDTVKKLSKTVNPFSQNYKNRKKLLQRINQRKLYNRVSPIRWDSRPEDIIHHQKQQNMKSNRWSPYEGKLGLFNRQKDPMLKTLQGNKIKYTHHQPKSYKRKIQQIIAE